MSLRKNFCKNLLFETYLISSFSFGAYSFGNEYRKFCKKNDNKHYYTVEFIGTLICGYIFILPVISLAGLGYHIVNVEDKIRYGNKK